MRQLTDSERTTMQASMREYHIKRDGLLPSKMRSFKAGFTAGLDHRQAEIDELTFAFSLAEESCVKLTAEIDRLRAALEPFARIAKLSGFPRDINVVLWQRSTNVEGDENIAITLADCIAAARALGETGEPE